MCLFIIVVMWTTVYVCLFIIVVMWTPVYVFIYYCSDVDTSLCVYLLL